MKPHRLSVSWFGLTISLTVCVDFIDEVDADHALPLCQYGSKVPLFLYLLRLVQSSCSGFALATALLRQWLRYGERVHQLSLKPSRVGRERLTRIERKGLNRPHRLKR